MKSSAIKRAIMVTAILAAAGCSTAPDKISAQYVSPEKYSNLSCQQIQNNLNDVEGRASAMYAKLRKERNKDNAVMAVGLVLFWPALFFVDGNSPDANTYARLKGDAEALTESQYRKGC